MLSLNDAVSMRVIGGNADVMNAIVVCKPIQRGDVGGTVVSNNFFDCAPSAQHVFEKEGSDRAAGFCMERAPFWPGGERTTSLSDVPKAMCRWPGHSVDIDFAEKGCWDSDSGRNANFGSLMQLALMAGIDKPHDFLLEGGPPEVV